MNELQCFVDCVVNAGLVIPLFGLITAFLICFLFFVISRKYVSLLGAQSFMSIIISVNLLSMNCDMFTWFWIYLGIILIGTIFVFFVKFFIKQYVGKNNIGSISNLFDIENEFNIRINVVDSPKIRAFVFMKKIYLSVGLLERLDKDEIRAVVAHEMYHLKFSPNKIISSLLAIASLTFRRYTDEYSADKYAANISGRNNLINALQKLNIKDSQKRIEFISK